ncbi:unnamed protein product [Spodoptera littoralis]|uniref:Spaetzle domain-containing protein n=1 Tax=Spodoptera littoralis TaxID=7109 RepID=A0A9P0I1G7_SPOLI|nr:unnamed protein product [Spodoptera littoralis]CAB3517047.1 unnamed protein product [Spodoptera littoralis]CAH1637305.1 unnamed protein product [Spodoptera littoralis]CAH1646954.1 unnamed protein product [Spodoptera littoralis]
MANLPRFLASVVVVIMAIHISANTVSTSVDGELLVDSRSMFKYQMPDACIGQSYCFEKGDNYPDDVIQKLDLNFESQNRIGTRKGSEIDEPDCPSKSNDGPIYYIMDENDAVRVVVQIPDKFTQRYNVRWCVNEGKVTNDTRHFMASRTFDKFDVECVSVKSKFNFVVLNQEENKIEVATANIPVCCKCRYDLKSRN